MLRTQEGKYMFLDKTYRKLGKEIESERERKREIASERGKIIQENVLTLVSMVGGLILDIFMVV